MTIATIAMPPVDEERVLAWTEDQDLVDRVFLELVRTIRPPVVSTDTLALPPLQDSVRRPDRPQRASVSGSERDCRAWQRSPPARG
ncbi:hypothetical protein [Lacisediminihabitans profunda]|uniref:Uncharacterized protein n=1 Tax=Lacisediminihabitans profunda TaxID=2594790 RepID=A0A5C8UTM6_9MICO|nr:hypothetical protein [Lacisediminihabitans profunda]TXN30968.1 hypothetical protein FVP33_05040 [Lacisediminihabitans profunda]